MIAVGHQATRVLAANSPFTTVSKTLEPANLLTTTRENFSNYLACGALLGGRSREVQFHAHLMELAYIRC